MRYVKVEPNDGQTTYALPAPEAPGTPLWVYAHVEEGILVCETVVTKPSEATVTGLFALIADAEGQAEFLAARKAAGQPGNCG